MSTDDDWRKKEKEDRRRAALYSAMRKGDRDAAIRAASPRNYLDYLKLRDSQREQPTSDSTQQPPGNSAQQIVVLTEVRKELLELAECTRLDIHGRINLIQMIFAINLASPDASQKLDQMRGHLRKRVAW